MIKALTIAAAIVVALCSSGCAQMGWGGGNDTGATGSTGMSGEGATGEVVMVPDAAGTASAGTGSVISGTLGQREITSSGQGID